MFGYPLFFIMNFCYKKNKCSVLDKGVGRKFSKGANGKKTEN